MARLRGSDRMGTMTGSQTLLARTALGVVAALASVVLVASRSLRESSRPSFGRIVGAAFIVSRLGLFCVLFLWIGAAPRGDIPSFYVDQAREVLQHKLPYRDFPSAYAPLHPYLDAGLYRLWHSPLSLMLFSLLAELLLLPLWLRVGRASWPESTVRAAALLYLASPISLQFVAVDGQDNVVIALLIALGLLLLLRGRAALSGASLGISIATFKFLPLLYAPIFFLAAPRRWRWAAGAALVVAAIYGGFLLQHAPVLQPLLLEGDLRSAGNLPFVLETLLGASIPGRLSDLLLLLVLLALFVLAAAVSRKTSRGDRTRIITLGISAATLSVLLLSKKSWPPYLMLSLFPICLLPAAVHRLRGPWVDAFAVFSLVAVTEHSVWASSFAQISASALHAALRAHEGRALLFVVLELLLLGGYAWLLFESIFQMVRAPAAASLPIPADPVP
jgi:hypothetical protein